MFCPAFNVFYFLLNACALCSFGPQCFQTFSSRPLAPVVPLSTIHLFPFLVCFLSYTNILSFTNILCLFFIFSLRSIFLVATPFPLPLPRPFSLEILPRLCFPNFMSLMLVKIYFISPFFQAEAQFSISKQCLTQKYMKDRAERKQTSVG